MQKTNISKWCHCLRGLQCHTLLNMNNFDNLNDIEIIDNLMKNIKKNKYNINDIKKLLQGSHTINLETQKLELYRL